MSDTNLKPHVTVSIARHADIGRLQRWELKDQLSKKNGPHSSFYMINGDRYLGSWKNNLKHGSGAYYYAKSGSLYEGEWANDMRNGYGTYSVKDDSLLLKAQQPMTEEAALFQKLVPKNNTNSSLVNAATTTTKKNNNTSAVGLPNPSHLRKVYAGEWRDDQRGGRGIYFYEDGSTYDGLWANSMREGWGRMNYSNGSVYEGEWHQEKRHGQGILLLKNGDRYEGMWMDDKKEGPGRFIYKVKRQCYKGEWAQDIPKFGTLVDLPPLPGKPAKMFTLPPLGLVNPDTILFEQHSLIVEERLERTINS